MNDPESNHDDADERLDDALLRDRLQAASLPGAPAGLHNKIKRRIGQRAFQRRAILAASTIIVVAFSGWMMFQRPDKPNQPVASSAAIDDELLASLFAPPPVDSLAVLDRRQQFALQALRQLEKPRP